MLKTGIKYVMETFSRYVKPNLRFLDPLHPLQRSVNGHFWPTSNRYVTNLRMIVLIDFVHESPYFWVNCSESF